MHYAFVVQTLFYKPDNSEHVAQRSKAVSRPTIAKYL